jgi:CHC2 zinc finger
VVRPKTSSPVRSILRAARAARAVLVATDPCGTGPATLHLAAREFAFALAGADQRSQRLGLVLLASQAAKNQPLADRATVVHLWGKLDQLKRPSPLPRPPRRASAQPHEPLPVEQARVVPVTRVFSSLGFDLRRRGLRFVTHCPFHDDQHPSLRLNPDLGVWYCDPCGIGGDAITFLQRYRRLDFATAVREVAAC